MKQYTTEAYKGFAIVHNDTTARYHVTNGGEITPDGQPINADGFKPEGYATLNNAKGAITKHASAAEGRAVFEASEALAATSDDTDRASVPAATISTDKPGDGWTRERTPNGDPIHANPRMAHVYAEMDYYGMSRQRDTRSRNKREGVYNGYTNGQHERAMCRNGGSRVLFSRVSDLYMPTRKHRKAVKLEMRATVALARKHGFKG